MKRLTNAVILLLGLSMAMMTSCTKDPDNGGNGGGNNGGGNTYNGHEYVDLGLPSGTLWATCNIGASIPEDLGSGFAWAGLEPYDSIGVLHPINAYWDESLQHYTKYNYEDGLRCLEQEDDIAAQNWGNGWRIPTPEEWEELYRNCSYELKFQNGQWGILLTRGEKSLFLPGFYEIYEGHPLGGGNYWANERNFSTESCAHSYNFIYYYLGHQRFEQEVSYDNRYMSNPVRPVYSSTPDEPQFTIVGQWISTEWFEVDDDGESEGEYTDEFSVIFTETTAKLHLYDCINGEIVSDYTFSDSDNSIIYFDNSIINIPPQGIHENYGLQIVGRVNEATGRLIIQVSGYEDGSSQLYYFRKQ